MKRVTWHSVVVRISNRDELQAFGRPVGVATGPSDGERMTAFTSFGPCRSADHRSGTLPVDSVRARRIHDRIHAAPWGHAHHRWRCSNHAARRLWWQQHLEREQQRCLLRPPRPSAAASGGAVAAGCEAYAAYTGHEGTKVTLFTSVLPPEQQRYEDAWKPFEDCTGIDIVYEGSDQFEAQLPTRIAGGNAPDLAWIPQPGLLAKLVQAGWPRRRSPVRRRQRRQVLEPGVEGLRHRRRHLLRAHRTART